MTDQTRARADNCISADVTAWANFNSLLNHCARLNNNVRADCNGRGNARLRIHTGTRVYAVPCF